MRIKDALKQYRFILIEIKDLTARLESEPEIADIFQRELRELSMIQKQTEDFITSISDPLTRQIFVMKYCLGLTDKAISGRLALNEIARYSQDAISAIRKRYIEKHDVVVGS